MSHEFNESEMYYCDICGEYLPLETMYELEDGRIVCEYCLEELEGEEYRISQKESNIMEPRWCALVLWKIV